MAQRALPAWVSGPSGQRAGRAAVDALFTAAWGGLSFALFAGKYIVKTGHPVLGTLAGVIALYNAADFVATAADAGA